jgi:hypothetical protein
VEWADSGGKQPLTWHKVSKNSHRSEVLVK